MNKKKISIWIGGLCLILTFAIAVQIRTINAKISVSDPSYVDDGLRDEVLRIQEDYQDKYKEFEKIQLELEKKRAKATENDAAAAEKEKEIEKTEAILGLSEVTGKGIEITLNDSQNISLSEDISSYLIHKEDIQSVINELKNAGAEAISVNDQRIVTNSTVDCIGNTIKVNGERIGAPFKIKAIGNQDMLYNALNRPGGYLYDLKKYYQIEVKIDRPSTNLTILKYSGIMKTKYMKEAK